MSPTSQKLGPISDRKTARSVLLCGASVRSLAESAIAAGLRPVCVDFFEDADLKELLSSGHGRFLGRIDSFEQLPRVIRSVRKSIPLLWAGGLENHTDVLRVVSQSRAVIGAAPAIIEQLRDPMTMQRWLSDAAIDSPRLATESTADSTCSWLRKSTASSGGLGIDRQAQAGRTEAAVSAEIYLQEYIDGVPMSATFCMDESGLHLFGMSLQLIGWPCLGATEFLFCGNAGPVDPGDQVRKQVLAIARVAADRSGIRGVFGIDFILRQGRVWFLEVNPRLTASHLLYELQHPGLLVHRHLRAFGWTPIRPQQSFDSPVPKLLHAPSPVSARLIVWANKDVRIPATFGELPHNWNKGRKRSSSKQVTSHPETSSFRIADRPQPDTVVRKSNPICSLHVTAVDLVSIEQRLLTIGNEQLNASWSAVCFLQEAAGTMHAIAGQLRLIQKKFTQNSG